MVLEYESFQHLPEQFITQLCVGKYTSTMEHMEHMGYEPSGKHTNNYWKSPLFIGKKTLSLGQKIQFAM